MTGAVTVALVATAGTAAAKLDPKARLVEMDPTYTPGGCAPMV
jgi:hypothetical protein